MHGQKTEPDLPFWSAILTRLHAYDPAPASVMSHISRFRIETGITNPRRPNAPRIVWLRPIKQVSPELSRGVVINQSPNLETYLSDGRVEICNNLVENAIRPTKLAADGGLTS